MGVGGGFLMVPLLVLWTKVDQRRAGGTSLAAILPIGLVAATVYWFGGGTPHVAVSVAVFMVLGSVAGAYVGARAAAKMPEQVLTVLVAFLLAGLGVKEVHDSVLGSSAVVHSPFMGTVDAAYYPLVSVSGFFIGILSGLTGLGGGVFMVPVMVLGFGLAQSVAQGTSLLAILPTAAVGAVTHYRDGHVDLRSVAWIGGAGVPAAVAGAALALWLPDRLLAALFGLFLLLAAILVLHPRRLVPFAHRRDT